MTSEQSSDEVAAGNGTGDIQAVQRVGNILRLFSLSTPRMTVAEAAQRVGLNRTTVHRYFNSLVQAEFLQRDQDEPTMFVPGRLLLTLGVIAQGQRRVLDLAPRRMKELSDRTDLTTVLSLWGASGPVVSLVSEAQARPILVTVRVGTQLGLESAQTRVFLALLDEPGLRQRWIRNVAAAERAALAANIEQAGRTGISRAAQPGINAMVVAAAVFDSHGIAATIALVGTEPQYVKDGSGQLDVLRATAEALTADLGGLAVRERALTD